MLRVGGRDPELGCFAKQNPTLHGARGLWGGDSGPAAPPWGCRARTSPPSRSTGVRGSCLLALLWLSSRPWPAASRAGTVCTVRAEPSLSSRRGLIFSLIWQGLGRGGGRAGRALPALENSRGGFQRCYLLKQETFAPLPSPPPGRDGARLCGVGLFSRSACLIHKLMIELGACPKGDGCPLPTPVPPSKG